MYEAQKSEMEVICHRLYERNLVAASDGNVSMRVSREHILLTPSGRNKGWVKADEMLVADLQGNTVEGAGKVSKEYPMHRLIYQENAAVKAVVHTHPVYATAFALAGKNIPDNYLIEARMMLKGIGLAEFAPPGTMELAETLLPFVKRCDAVLLKNHGAVTYGESLEKAFNKMEILESIAKTIIVSGMLGTPCVITPENMDKMIKK